MNENTTTQDIESMAARAGMKMGDVCREAGVSHATFSRWKAGVKPTKVTISALLYVFSKRGIHL